MFIITTLTFNWCHGRSFLSKYSQVSLRNSSENEERKRNERGVFVEVLADAADGDYHNFLSLPLAPSLAVYVYIVAIIIIESIWL